MKRTLLGLYDDFNLWRKSLGYYVQRNVVRLTRWFETQKDTVVDILMARRGMYQRPFMHFSIVVLFTAGIVSAPILADTYPGMKISADVETYTPPSAVVSSLDLSEYGVETRVSQKPRDQILEYKVESGDTLSSIAEKFGVSIQTIQWANNLTGTNLQIAQALKIPPVTGVVHRVREGETIYSIAKKYKTEAQGIVNFPFNDFTDLDTFALAVGQTLIVPDGVIQQAAPVARPQTPSFASPQAPITGGGSGQFMWPTNGVITQYPIWYHMALDIANNSQPPIAAAGEGVVSSVQYLRYGYGQHVIIDHGAGNSTLYGHMSEIYVKPGDRVGRGQVIGKMGTTGRSTGIHLHFEVRRNGVAVNPLGYLK